MTEPRPSAPHPADAPTARPPLPARARWVGPLLLALVGAAMVLNLVWLARNCSALRVMGPGHKAPAFDLRTIHGDRVRLADLRGRVVLIDFWSVTCPPCLESLPHLNQLVDTFADEPVTVLAIHAQGGPRWRAVARREATRLGLRFPVLVDTPRGQTGNAYTVRVLPTTVLVDARGRIRKVWRGATDVESLEAEIRAALKQRR